MMNERFQQQVDQGQWLVDLSAYDTSVAVTAQQAQQLTTYLSLTSSDGRRANLEAELDTILKPLADVMAYMGVSRQSYTATRRLLLQQTLQSGRTLWGWIPVEMVTYLNESQDLNVKHRQLLCKQPMMAIFYLLRGWSDLEAVQGVRPAAVARWVFGQPAYAAVLTDVRPFFVERGYSLRWCQYGLVGGLSYTLLKNYRWSLADLTLDFLQQLYSETQSANYKQIIVRLTEYLKLKGHLDTSLQPNWNRLQKRYFSQDVLADVPSDWLTMCQNWFERSTRSERYNRHLFYTLLKMGRWLQSMHPDCTHPADWTRDTAMLYTAMVCEMRVGDWTAVNYRKDVGKPLSPSAIQDHLTAASNFFGDCQEWGWIDRRFDPRLCFRLPHRIRQLDPVQPRAIDDDIWAKLLYAGLHLELEDLYANPDIVTSGRNAPYYPIEMIRTLSIVWLFAALRRSEIRRLRLNCIHWQGDRVCLLQVPPGKSGRGRTIAVDGIVGQSISHWQQMRPDAAQTYDATTGSEEDFLFTYQHRTLGTKYINRTLIPALCRKMNLPLSDSLGKITSHRARSTIATQLANAEEAMSFLQLKDWLGHQDANATRRYIELRPTRLMKAYTDAGYFERNLRQIQVLIDRDRIESQGASTDEPWKYYDLAHGYCTYDFFQNCRHLLACARCSHYRPKASSEAQMLEAKENLLRLKTSVPLTDEMQQAVDSGVHAVQALIERLHDVPTPSGQTPRELGRQTGFIPLDSILQE